MSGPQMTKAQWQWLDALTLLTIRKIDVASLGNMVAHLQILLHEKHPPFKLARAAQLLSWTYARLAVYWGDDGNCPACGRAQRSTPTIGEIRAMPNTEREQIAELGRGVLEEMGQPYDPGRLL